jgi:hypothetical protein
VTGSGLAVPPLSASAFFHTPSHLAKSILTSEASLEGERRQVTVLFSDMKGSTEYIADLDPEDARRLLDPVLERMMEAVDRYEGTVNQMMGDGIQVLFGAPTAFEDHVVRACFAALKMQKLITRVQASSNFDLRVACRANVLLHIKCRIGRAHGIVLIRQRRAKQGHDAVTLHPVDRTLIAVDSIDHRVQRRTQPQFRLKRNLTVQNCCEISLSGPISSAPSPIRAPDFERTSIHCNFRVDRHHRKLKKREDGHGDCDAQAVSRRTGC